MKQDFRDENPYETPVVAELADKKPRSIGVGEMLWRIFIVAIAILAVCGAIGVMLRGA